MMAVVVSLVLSARSGAAEPRAAGAPEALSQQELGPLIEEAIRNNPLLMASREQAAAARARVAQAAAWQAPQIGVDFFQTPIDQWNPITEGKETDYFVAQTIPFPGKLGNAAKAAASLGRMVESSAKAAEQGLVRDVKVTYYELFLAQQRLAINADNQALMRQFVDLARQQYEVGTGTQQDVLKAQTELSTLSNDALVLEQERRLAEAALATLLGRRQFARFGPVPEPALTRSLPDLAQLTPLVSTSQPLLLATQHAIDAAQAESARARREYFPNLMVRLVYKQVVDARDAWEMMLAAELPFVPWSGSGIGARVEEAEIQASRAAADYSAQQNQAMLEVQRALVRIETSRSLDAAYTTAILPQAEQTLQSAVAAYETGKGSFLSLLDAYRTLLARRLDRTAAIGEQAKAWADLERAVGLPLDRY
jgi:outer membrane protein, heavy metal efflux system